MGYGSVYAPLHDHGNASADDHFHRVRRSEDVGAKIRVLCQLRGSA